MGSHGRTAIEYRFGWERGRDGSITSEEPGALYERLQTEWYDT